MPVNHVSPARRSTCRRELAVRAVADAALFDRLAAVGARPELGDLLIPSALPVVTVGTDEEERSPARDAAAACDGAKAADIGNDACPDSNRSPACNDPSARTHTLPTFFLRCARIFLALL